MSTFRTISGSAAPTLTTVALTTVPAVLVAASTFNRRLLLISSTLPFAIIASTTVASSTLGFPVPANVPIRMEVPAITQGPINAIAQAGVAAIVSVLAC